jgi:hypothetical protein
MSDEKLVMSNGRLRQGNGAAPTEHSPVSRLRTSGSTLLPANFPLNELSLPIGSLIPHALFQPAETPYFGLMKQPVSAHRNTLFQPNETACFSLLKRSISGCLTPPGRDV